MTMNGTRGRLFNIQHYSVQDGPGIRTTVFFKGCPLSCRWCSNPESQNTFPEVGHINSLCNKCGLCVETCEPKAICLDETGITIDRKKCTNCCKCIDVCIPGALKTYGMEKSVKEVLHEIKRDRKYYLNSGGGVTASGGEPLVQSAFLMELFETCKHRDIHTTLDTSGCIDPETLKQVLQHTDLVLYDLKNMDPHTHMTTTGVSNDLILDNARIICSTGVPVIFRVPVIPGVNDSEENMQACAEFAISLEVKQIDLLPYHKLGLGKHESLDRTYELNGVQSLSSEEIEGLRQIIDSFGLNCSIGG
ncbi:glycyl-radical enzyme activating protein [Chloroflexota bacterium]